MVDIMEKEEYLVEGETILYSIEGVEEGYIGNLYFTEKRILITGKTGLFSQKAKFKDIMFHHISSIEWRTISHLWMLILGIIFVIIGLVYMNDATINQTFTVSLLGLIIGLIFIVIYFYIKESRIIFITESEKISFRFGGASAETDVKKITKIIRKFDK